MKFWYLVFLVVGLVCLPVHHSVPSPKPRQWILVVDEKDEKAFTQALQQVTTAQHVSAQSIASPVRIGRKLFYILPLPKEIRASVTSLPQVITYSESNPVYQFVEPEPWVRRLHRWARQALSAWAGSPPAPPDERPRQGAPRHGPSRTSDPVGGANGTRTVDASKLWGLARVTQRQSPDLTQFSPPPQAGHGVTVFVLDDGVENHADFQGRLVLVDAGLGLGTGGSHGTHVAGTIAGTSVGVAPHAQVVGMRVLEGMTGSMHVVVAGLGVVSDRVKKAGTGKFVVNMSLGARASPGYTALSQAVQELTAMNVVVVVAAGNDHVDACTFDPANIPAAITVGATDRQDQMTSFSNMGRCVDVFAPGLEIYSYNLGGGYQFMGGTSMASPHVAGVAAAYLSSGLSAQQTEQAIRGQSTENVVRGLTPDTPNRMVFLNPTGQMPDGSSPEAPSLPPGKEPPDQDDEKSKGKDDEVPGDDDQGNSGDGDEKGHRPDEEDIVDDEEVDSDGSPDAGNGEEDDDDSGKTPPSPPPRTPKQPKYRGGYDTPLSPAPRYRRRPARRPKYGRRRVAAADTRRQAQEKRTPRP